MEQSVIVKYLGAVILGCVLGAVGLAVTGRSSPEWLGSLAMTSAGALAGVLVPKKAAEVQVGGAS